MCATYHWHFFGTISAWSNKSRSCSTAQCVDNIAYGDPTADQGRIEEAARAARAYEFIAELPEGYETWIGERGVKLSVGQKAARLDCPRAAQESSDRYFR
jgi:ABC-type transport system involved in cytochrome bd biosynthesis fused ATPase/permease subunit